MKQGTWNRGQVRQQTPGAPCSYQDWFRQVSIVVFLVLCLIFMVGCEEGVDPIIGSDYPFTVWGFMNSGADTQRVRVFPITGEVIPDGSQGIDARVYSTNLTTGERREWSYRAVEFDSLVTGHLFLSPFRAEHEHRYRLEVVRSDGETSSVEVTVPPPVTFEIEAQQEGSLMHVRIERDVPHLVGFRVTYNTINIPPGNAWPPGGRVHPPVEYPVTVNYDDKVQRGNDGWTVVVDMRQDFMTVQDEYRLNCLITAEEYSAPDIWLHTVTFSVLAADSTWSPAGGVFDLDRLARPGTFSNVENGFGFFGAGQGIRYNWSASVEAKVQAGYGFEQRCNRIGDPTERPDCMKPPIPCIGDNLEEFWELWLR